MGRAGTIAIFSGRPTTAIRNRSVH